MGNALWGGVRLRDVLNRAGVNADALEVVFDGADQQLLPGTPDFVKSLPVDRALDEHTLIAFEMNGEPLPHWNGAPARLVVAGWTATYWVKHLTSIRVEPKAFDGFWMKSAYRIPTGAFPGARFASQENAADDADHRDSHQFARHQSRERRSPRSAVDRRSSRAGRGTAAAASAPSRSRWTKVARGERRTLGEAPSSYSWRGFRAALDTSKPGPLHIAVRATGAQRCTPAGETDAESERAIITTSSRR